MHKTLSTFFFLSPCCLAAREQASLSILTKECFDKQSKRKLDGRPRGSPRSSRTLESPLTHLISSFPPSFHFTCLYLSVSDSCLRLGTRNSIADSPSNRPVPESRSRSSDGLNRRRVGGGSRTGLPATVPGKYTNSYMVNIDSKAKESEVRLV